PVPRPGVVGLCGAAARLAPVTNDGQSVAAARVPRRGVGRASWRRADRHRTEPSPCRVSVRSCTEGGTGMPQVADVVRVRRLVGRSLVAVALVVAAVGCTGDDGDGTPDGEVLGDGDTYEATIRRTTGGVPHITGDTMA